MALKLRLPTIAAVLSLSFAVGCADDEAPEETVQPTAETAPEVVTEEPPPVVQDFAPETIYFDFDDYTIKPDAQERLTALANHLKSNNGAVVQIEGHCDERGSNEYNLALGERRAQSVKDYLANMGVDGARLTTISYGEEKPVAEGHEEQAWGQNRRAEFTMTNR